MSIKSGQLELLSFCPPNPFLRPLPPSSCLEEWWECCYGYYLPFKTLMGSLCVCFLSLCVACALRFSSVDSRSLEWSLTTESPSDGEILQTHIVTWIIQAWEYTNMRKYPCIIVNSAFSERKKQKRLLGNAHLVLSLSCCMLESVSTEIIITFVVVGYQEKRKNHY